MHHPYSREPLPVGDVAGLRVAHLIESDGPGGAERVVALLATTLQAAGARGVVFLPANGEGWLARELEGSGVSVEYFRINRPFSPACARSLAAAFRRHDIAVAHSHEFSLAVYGTWASWLAGVHHVITMHGSRYYAGRLQRRLAMRAAVAFSGRTVAVSNSLADQMSRDLRVARSQIAMIANGVRYLPRERTTLRDELRLGPDDRLLVAVGNLYPVKGHQYLIDAVALLASRHPNLHLAISGRGELAEALASRARDHGLADKVHLLGLRSDVAAVLAAADIFVLPSLSEGLPMALLEAMFALARLSPAPSARSVRCSHTATRACWWSPVTRRAWLWRSTACSPTRTSRARSRSAPSVAYQRIYDVSQMVRRYVGAYMELLAPRWNSSRSDAAFPRVSGSTPRIHKSRSRVTARPLVRKRCKCTVTSVAA